MDSQAQKSGSDSEFEASELSDWYNSSDTSEDIPDPNMSQERKYQDQDCLPTALNTSHFEEGLIYTMTLYAAQNNSMLIWIIQAKQKSFTFRCLFHQGSGAKTWHETGKSKECRYDEV